MCKKKTVVLRGIKTFGVFALLAAASLSCGAKEGTGITLPDQEISSIQIDGIKFDDFGSQSLDEFGEALEAAVPAGDAEVQRGDNYQVVTLRFADQSKESFYFFRYEDAWYIEDTDGVIYQNGEFIEDYVSFGDTTKSTVTIDLTDTSLLERTIQACLRLEEMGVSFSTEDLRAAFILELQKYTDQFDTEDEAVEAAGDELTYLMVRYQYAVDQGYGATDEELEQESEPVKSASNFDELEEVFAEYGTTYDDYQNYMEEYSRITATANLLENAIYEEFRHGNDQIGDTICDNYTEYFTCYLQEIVYPEMEDYKNETVIPLIDEAKEFYNTEYKDLQ